MQANDTTKHRGWRTGLTAVAVLGVSAVLALTTACGPQPTSGEPPQTEPTQAGTTAQPSDPASTEPSSTPSSTPSQKPTEQPTKPSDKPTTKPTDKPTQKPTEKPILAPGSSGEQVRELQHRLLQLDWFNGSITGSYGSLTTAGVEGFQDKRGYPTTGSVDAKTWAKLVDMTRTPTHDEKHNVLKPGPAIMEKGSTGTQVKQLQSRLKQIGWYSGNVTGTYGDVTVSGVKGFQGKRAIPVTGEVDQRTWTRLLAMTRTPTSDELNNRAPSVSSAGLDSRCMTGRALCISKSNNTLAYVVDGKAQSRFAVRFGSELTPTREGTFSVGWKSRNHVSSIYHTAMPFAMFFSGGQAVHYSADFAARGYNGASHGCVNVRDYNGIAALFDQVRVGDKVIVYR